MPRGGRRVVPGAQLSLRIRRCERLLSSSRLLGPHPKLPAPTNGLWGGDVPQEIHRLSTSHAWHPLKRHQEASIGSKRDAEGAIAMPRSPASCSAYGSRSNPSSRPVSIARHAATISAVSLTCPICFSMISLRTFDALNPSFGE